MTVEPLTLATVCLSVWVICVSVVVKRISSPATQSTGSLKVIDVWPAAAVAPKRVQETLRGIPCKSRPPKTPITRGPTVPAPLGNKTMSDDEPVMTISTFDVSGLFGHPMEIQYKINLKSK